MSFLDFFLMLVLMISTLIKSNSAWKQLDSFHRDYHQESPHLCNSSKQTTDSELPSWKLTVIPAMLLNPTPSQTLGSFNTRPYFIFPLKMDDTF